MRLVLTGALVLFGIHAFGLPGAIVGGIISEAVARVVMLARGRRFLEVSWAHVLDWGNLLRTTTAAVVACAPALGLRMVVDRGVAGVLAGAVAYGATYLGVSFVLGRLFRGGAAQAVGHGEHASSSGGDSTAMTLAPASSSACRVA